MEKRFKESSICEDYSKELSKKSYLIGPSNVAKIATASVHGISTFLGSVKSINVPKAVVIRKDDHSFLAGAKVEFVPNGNDLSSGRWDYSWTFYEDDLKGADCIEATGNSHISSFIQASGLNLFNMKYSSPDLTITMMDDMIKMIKSWLHENVSDNDDATLTLDGVFTATASMEDGEVVYGFVPAGDMKVLIKDDSAIQEA